MNKERNYAAEYAKRPYYSRLCGWYKSEDKRKGRKNDLSSAQVKVLIELPCYWCGKPQANGLDRKDSNIGHISGNVVPSCYKCNMILGTLPFSGKEVMKESLKNLRESGLIDDWDPPNPFKK